MPDVKELVRKKNLEKQSTHKIDRSAFIYMDPRESDPKHPGDGTYKDFAQCGVCMMYTGAWLEKGEKSAGCTIMGPKVPIRGDIGSCALFVPGPNHTDMRGKEMKATTPKEAGYVETPVRCENCKYFDKSMSVCMLFMRLNNQEPGMWNLDPMVKAKGCCNAFMKI